MLPSEYLRSHFGTSHQVGKHGHPLRPAKLPKYIPYHPKQPAEAAAPTSRGFLVQDWQPFVAPIPQNGTFPSKLLPWKVVKHFKRLLSPFRLGENAETHKEPNNCHWIFGSRENGENANFKIGQGSPWCPLGGGGGDPLVGEPIHSYGTRADRRARV
jgi:hypothetical protein